MKRLLQFRKTLIILLLAGVGLAKLPLEQRLAADLQDRHLVENPPDLGMADNLGQMGAAATLGGLRALVAGITYLEAYGAFEDVNWGQVDLLMTLTTHLEPYDTTYWEEASWHMAYNAASYYERDQTLPPLLRAKLVRNYQQRGVDILNEGLRFLPDDPRLYLKLGLIYKDKLMEPRKAAAAFLQCYAHGGQDYAERMAAYELTKVNEPDANKQAYEILKRYYDLGMKKKGTTIMIDLPILEDRLGIPPEKRRVPQAEDDLPRYRLKMPRPNAVEPKKN